MTPDPLHVILILGLLAAIAENVHQLRIVQRVKKNEYGLYKVAVCIGAHYLAARLRDDGQVSKALDPPLFLYDYLESSAQAVASEESTFARYLDALEVQEMLRERPGKRVPRDPANRMDAVIVADYERYMDRQMQNRPPGADTGGAG